MNRILAVFLLCLLACSSGCVCISKTAFDGTGLRYPVSMSQSILDASGQTYKPTDAEKVAHFKRDWTHWAMLWGAISLTSHVDLSALLNEEIEAAGGNGVVNLKLRADSSGLTWLISLMMIVPDHAKLEVEGDVIKSSAVRL